MTADARLVIEEPAVASLHEEESTDEGSSDKARSEDGHNVVQGDVLGPQGTKDVGRNHAGGLPSGPRHAKHASPPSGGDQLGGDEVQGSPAANDEKVTGREEGKEASSGVSQGQHNTAHCATGKGEDQQRTTTDAIQEESGEGKTGQLGESNDEKGVDGGERFDPVGLGKVAQPQRQSVKGKGLAEEQTADDHGGDEQRLGLGLGPLIPIRALFQRC